MKIIAKIEVDVKLINNVERGAQIAGGLRNRNCRECVSVLASYRVICDNNHPSPNERINAIGNLTGVSALTGLLREDGAVGRVNDT